MRTLLLVVVVAIVGAVANAQITAAQTIRLEFSAMKVGDAHIMAQTARTANNTIELRGSVRIEVGTTVITADEADVRVAGTTGTTEYDLRGNVHVSTRR